MIWKGSSLPGGIDNVKAALNRVFVVDSKQARELGEKVYSVKLRP